MNLSDWALGTTIGQWTVLFSFGAILIFCGTVAYRITPGTEATPANTWYESAWASYTLWADVGTQTGFVAADPGQCLFVAIVFSFLGFVYNLALLGLVVDVIRGQLAHWKWAKSRISARDHILILGWGDKTLFLLDELVAANVALHGKCGCGRRHGLRRKIVILAEHSVHDMQQDVKTYFMSRARSKSVGNAYKRIEFRRGDPADQAELLKVSAPFAEDILIMSHGQGESVGSDQRVLQTLLSLAALNLELPLQADIFAEMQTQDALHVMRDIFPKAEGIIARQAVNRMVILRALVSSVGFAYLDMVSFNRGGEMHLIPVPKALVGSTFSESVRLFKDAVVMGVKAGPGEEDDDSKPNNIQGLVPAGGRPFARGDVLVVFATERAAADAELMELGDGSKKVQDTTGAEIRFQDLRMADGQLRLGPTAAGPKVILLLGCPPDFPDFLEMLDCYLQEGSEVHVLSERNAHSRADLLRKAWGTSEVTSESDLRSFLKRISVTQHYGSPQFRWALRLLPLERADCAIILAETLTKQDTPDAADSRSLTTVITLRAMMPKDKSKKKCKVVTELVHPKSQLVVQGNGNLRKHGSFVYSTLQETGVFALASEDKQLYEILMQILSPDNEAGHISVARSSDFIRGVEALSFFDLHDRILAQSNCILLGWRRSNEQYPKLNPDQKSLPLDWDISKDDELILFCPAKGLRQFKLRATSQSDTSSILPLSSSPEPPVQPLKEELLSSTAGIQPASTRDLPILPGTLPHAEESESFLDRSPMSPQQSP